MPVQPRVAREREVQELAVRVLAVRTPLLAPAQELQLARRPAVAGAERLVVAQEGEPGSGTVPTSGWQVRSARSQELAAERMPVVAAGVRGPLELVEVPVVPEGSAAQLLETQLLETQSLEAQLRAGRLPVVAAAAAVVAPGPLEQAERSTSAVKVSSVTLPVWVTQVWVTQVAVVAAEERLTAAEECQASGRAARRIPKSSSTLLHARNADWWPPARPRRPHRGRWCRWEVVRRR